MTSDDSPPIDLDVERLMEEIRRRAERQRESAPAGTTMTTAEDSASDPVPKRLHEALSAQAALNAAILDALMGIADRLARTHRADQAYRQELAGKVERGELFSSGLTNEMERLGQDLAALRETAEGLNQVTAELLTFADETGQQLTDLKEALGRVDGLAIRVVATEEKARELAAHQERTRTDLEQQARSLARQARLQHETQEELAQLAAATEQSATGISSLEEQVAGFEASVARKMEELQIRVLRAERSLRARGQGDGGGNEMPVRIPDESPAERGLPSEEILDYFLFEQRFRGTLDEIRERQAIYLDIFRDKQNVLDLGCGRGEFVELLAMYQVPVTGVDANPDMVDFCRERGLNVVLADAFAYLHDCADGSLDGMFSAQVVEHLPPMEATRLIALAAAKLRPAGVLVVETVNIHCPSTLSSFFLDPTHIRPLPAQLLEFMFEQCALKVTGVKYSSPVDGRLPFVLDVSHPTPPEAVHYQDYAIIAVK